MTEPVNLGVFYDGGWFAHVSGYFAFSHPWRARIALQGLHDALRWHVHSVAAVPVTEVVLAEAHYVRGRSDTPSSSFDRVLEEAGVVRHDAGFQGGKESGADVMLALEAWTRAVSRLTALPACTARTATSAARTGQENRCPALNGDRPRNPGLPRPR